MGFLSALGSLVGSAGVGSIVGGVLGYKGQRETNKQNYDMFQQQLEYDKPVNQVARLKEAGLNPNLVYGSGIQNMQTAGKQPEMKNSMDKALEGLNLGMLSANLRKSKAEASLAESSAKRAAVDARLAEPLGGYALFNAFEGFRRNMLNNQRLAFDNNLLMQGISPSFDRGIASQVLRMLFSGFNRFRDELSGGLGTTSRPAPRVNGANNTPMADGSEFLSIMSPQAFTPAGSWYYGSSYY